MKRKVGIMIGVGVVVVLAVAGVGLTVTGFLPKLLGMKPPEGTLAAKVEVVKPKEPLAPERYYDVPLMIVSLEAGPRDNRTLQLSISLLMDNRDEASQMHSYVPIIIDAAQVYIRTLPISETVTVARLTTHRDALLARINAAIAPLHAEELNFRQVQQQ